MRKDRYSALLIANMVAREAYLKPPSRPYATYDGSQEGYFSGPEWYRTKAKDLLDHYGGV